MSGSSDSIKQGALIGVILVSSTVGAHALTVARCNVKHDGAFRPALVVDGNGEKTIHHIGEDGLTRSAVFNEAKALAWASKRYGSEIAWDAAACQGAGGSGGGSGSGGDDDDDDDDDSGYNR